MSINKQKLAYLAKLSKFSTEDQTEKTVQSLQNMINLLDHLKTVEVKHLLPLSHPLDETQILRKDKVNESSKINEIKKNAPAISEDHCFITPLAVKSET